MMDEFYHFEGSEEYKAAIQAMIDGYQGYDVEKEVAQWTERLNKDFFARAKNSDAYIEKAMQYMEEAEHRPILDVIAEWVNDHSLFLACYAVHWAAFILGLIIWMLMGYLQ